MSGVRALGAVTVLSLVACAEWVAPRPGLTEQDEAMLAAMVSKGAPGDPSNEFLADDAVAELGQQLFFDRGLSNVATDGGFALATQGVPCVQCHAPTTAFSDPRTVRNVSLGLGWTGRNTPTLLNVAFYEWWGWDGRADTLWGQAVHAYEAAPTMGGDPLRLARALFDRYPDRYRAVFNQSLPEELDPRHPNAARFERPRSPEAEAELRRIYERSLKAWGAYLSRLVSLDAPFDRFAQGDDHALSEGARRGLLLFIGKAGCVQCHRGPMFTDNQFHGVGVGQSGPNVPSVDTGRFTGLERLKANPFRRSVEVATPTEADVGRFRTKGLRNVALTGPFMHAGQLETLKDVVWFYNRGGDRAGAGPASVFLEPLGLGEREQGDLVLFLEALNGAPPAARWACDNSRPTFVGMKREFGAACAVIP